MPASSNAAAVPDPQAQVPLRPAAPAGVSMRDLLASCAAADAISRPPRDPGPRAPQPVPGHGPTEAQAA
ncbi:hypothetical protein [Streptomyces sp. V3I7]|uniref:hypothetical protein n=1 Tax=Streptomyces sp. V3I7 TaxID=3042278 RepID=UPI00278AC94A|nr:hypothetical protein [Streptomyces sp. V3I7]MDQ0992523.1 hypothetical protein [Streptomyces sp. V3I7]